MDQTKFKSSLRRTIVVPLIAALILAGVALWAAYDLNASMQWVDQTDQVIGQSKRLLELVVDMETGERGYLVTGKGVFLQPYLQASKLVDSEYEALYRLVADNPAQQARLLKLHDRFRHWQGYAEQMIALRRTGGAYSDLSMNLAGKGELDEIRDQMAQFQQVEERLRDERSRLARRMWRTVAIFSILLCLGVGVGLAAFTVRRIKVIAASFEKSRSALAESERRWATTLASIGDAVIAADRHGRVTFLNPVAANLTGWQSEDAIGQPVQNVFHIINEQTRVPAEDIVGHVLKGGRVVELANHTALLAKHGREIPITDSTAPIFDSDGTIVGVVLVFHDVTERRRAENVLRATLQRFYLILSNLSSGVLLVTNEGEIEFANQAFCDLFGLKESPAELAESFDSESVIAKIETAYQNPGMEILRIREIVGRGQSVQNEELSMRSGSTFLRDFVPLTVDGKPYGRMWVHTDITERKRGEEKLRKSAATLAAALASLTDSVIITDAEGRFVDFNDSFATFYRFKSKADCARDFDQFASLFDVFMANGERAPREMFAIQRALRGERATNVEYTLRRKDSGETWIGSISFSPIRDKVGAIAGAVITSRDITEDKRAEEERQIAVDFLGMVNQSRGTRDLIRRATTFFQERSGCEAVGIRLRDGEDYPYFESCGFSREFILHESQLCARAASGKILKDSGGNPVLECLCGNVIRGCSETSKPFHTARGSFWTNSTTELIANTTEADLPPHMRLRCHREGYESVALFPVYFAEERFGLLQLNDRHVGRFSARAVVMWERLAGHLATAIYKFRAEEALQESEAQFRNLANTIPQLCWMANADGWIFWYNERWYEYTGTTPQQMEGWGWQSVHDPAALPKVLEAWTGSIATGNPFDMVFPLRGGDGVFRPFLTRVIPVKDSDGKVVRWFGTNTDISEQKQIEAELRKSRERLDLALDVAKLGEWERDPINGAAFRSLRHAQVFGYTSTDSEWSLERFIQHVLPEHRDRAAALLKFPKPGGYTDFETQIRRVDGEVRWIWVRSNTEFDAIGQPLRAFGIVMDITERKHDEEELKKLNRTLKALSNSDQAILHAANESEFLNEVCRIITTDCGHAMVWIGIAEHDEAKTVRPVAHSGIDEGYLETLRVTWDSEERGRGPTGTAIRTGQPSMCRNMFTDPAFAPWRKEALKRGYGSSLVIPLKERDKAWGAITIYSWEPDAFSEGAISLLTELARDLEFGVQTLRIRAARAQAEEALRQSEELLGLFVEHAPAALAMFDDDMRYLYASRRWKADYGIGDGEFRGVSHYDLFPEIPERWKEAHRRGLAGEVLSGEADRFERADGTEQWIRWEVRPWRDAEGKVGGIVIFSEEITERKKAEEARLRSEKVAFQRQQLQALAVRLQQVREEERTMVARELHDQIGQILTAIKMDVAWVARHLTDSEDEERKRLERSIGMINDGVRSVRKICSGLRPGILDDLGLAAAIEWQANEFASRTGISCKISVPPQELHLDGDRATAFFRIFQECLTNVARHAEARTVRTSLYEQDENLLLVVEDDGKGFSESDVTGSSLGVLGMKERAQACGGHVQLSSSPGRGTKVTVRIRLHGASTEREDHAKCK